MSRDLLFSVTKKDLKFETFSAGGPGGQAQNRVASGVRIRHPASGAVAEARENRSQLDNKRAAWKRLIETPKFKLWLKMRISEATMDADAKERAQRRIDIAVDRAMNPSNILVEVKDETGHWVAAEG